MVTLVPLPGVTFPPVLLDVEDPILSVLLPSFAVVGSFEDMPVAVTVGMAIATICVVIVPQISILEKMQSQVPRLTYLRQLPRHPGSNAM